MILIYLELFVVLTSLVLAAVSDIRIGKVKNKQIIITAGICFFISIIRVTRGEVDTNVVPFAINLILSVAMAIVLYMLDIWAPGDCKMLILLSAFVPSRFWFTIEGNVFPSINLVAFSFAFGFIWLVLTSILKKPSNERGIRCFSLKNINIIDGACGWGFAFGMNRILDYFSPRFVYSNMLLCTLIVVAFSILIQNKVNMLFKILGIIGMCYGLLETFYNKNFASAAVYFLISLSVVFLVAFFRDRASHNIYKNISGDDLSAGMILSIGSIMMMRGSRIKDLPHATNETRFSRLSNEQAEAVRKWANRNHQTVTIVQMLPFIPFMCIAFLFELAYYIIISFQ